VNWMTAGSGIAHSERFEDPESLAGGELEMIQTWVALPEKDEEAAPSFSNYTPEQLPVFTEKGVWMRLIAGDAYGLRNDVKTHSPLFYLHVVLQSGARLGLPKEHSERGFYIAKGSVEVAGTSYREGQMLVFTKGVDPLIVAKEPATLMLLGGEPLGERFIWWNFVSSRKGRIEQAKEDWKQGRIILPPNDNQEFIPLPEDKSKPAGSAPRPEPLS
jgi:redox-sensitive bicupin YhaK (pirin superfamily)